MMTILRRISRLFKADMHGILDNLEAPEMILKQAVRDMQEEIDKAYRTTAELNKELECLQKKKHNLSEYTKTLQQQLDFCLQANNESLAKSIIRKKLQTELSLKELEGQIQHLTEEQQNYQAETEERQEKLQAIRDKLAVLLDPSEQYDMPLEDDLSTSISQDDIELAFLYEQQRYANTKNNEGELSHES